ncbi:hypothetical protein [Tsukamurella sp. 1534]|uniref:hypothetical protein n=1 Tax=Tsukamurella sp. 1534 TaxID=1151061 RepID=UPI00031B9AC6|nr:hypothetical protein [Tsukamurella sp. 1534]
MPEINVARTRSITFNPDRDTLTVENIRDLVDGCGSGQVVLVTVDTIRGDRPYESDQTTVILEVEDAS